MKWITTVSALLTAFLLQPAFAQQVTIDFEEFSVGDAPDWDLAAPLKSQGYEFDGGNGPCGQYGCPAEILIGQSGSKSFGAANGWPGQDGYGATVYVEMRRQGGGVFAIHSLDLVLEDGCTNPALCVVDGREIITGTLPGGSAADLSVPVGTGDWLNLEEVEFSAEGDGTGQGQTGVFVEVDNIVVSAVNPTVTIDFEEFIDDTRGTSWSKGYTFNPTGTGNSNGVWISYTFTNNFRVFDSEPACGGGCFANAGIEFHRNDDGPFAIYGLDTFGVDPDTVEGKSAVDGTWFTFGDNPAFGTGPWLNVTAVRYEAIEEAVSSNVNVQVRADNVVVGEVINADIDLDPWSFDRRVYPNNDYILTVGVKTLSIADGDAQDFDATTIDPSTVAFGPDSAPNIAIPIQQDIDSDGDTDIVFAFNMQETGISCVTDDNIVKLVATTTSGQTVAGKYKVIKTFGCTGDEVIDFQDLDPGVQNPDEYGFSQPFVYKGFRFNSNGGIVDRGGDKSLDSAECDDSYPCFFFSGFIDFERADNEPFALYSWDLDAICDWQGGCEIEGETIVGTKVGPNSTPLGTGGWLGLRRVRIATYTADWECYACYISLDDIKVRDPSLIPVEVDFDPWSSANKIRPKDTYVITMELTNTSVADGDAFDFDPTTVDPTTLRLGPNKASLASPTAIINQDRDGDGDIDRTFGFNMQDTGNTCTDGSITIEGFTYSGEFFQESDVVVPVGCEEPMTVDVEPYSALNRVYPNDDYQVQVAVKSTSVADGDAYDFNPFSINANTLKFGPGEAANVITPISADVDGDGDSDRIFAFEMQDSGIACGDTEVTLLGSRNPPPGDTVGIPLVGMDSIQTEECVSCHP
jgi:hypothetical protein